jgi:hypothetical protein
MKQSGQRKIVPSRQWRRVSAKTPAIAAGAGGCQKVCKKYDFAWLEQ